MQSTSPQLTANLSRLSVETYVDSNYSVVTKHLFKNKDESQKDPSLLLSELESDNYTLPNKTRDIYLYLPYRMLNIFPTVSVFGNLNLNTGKKLREMTFYPTTLLNNKKGILQFKNGIVFDSKKGELILGSKKGKVKYFITTQNTPSAKIQMQSQLMHIDAEYSIVYMKSYGKFLIMDNKTFNSTYVQMFVLGKYDKNLFELVVSSPYSKIYKLKK
jgi:dolichyl-diphosphooligosaccharide--protein glycosyltransferase/undecaprenyl-diphosphooligosaccharide--protein glycosyltransferase